MTDIQAIADALTEADRLILAFLGERLHNDAGNVLMRMQRHERSGGYELSDVKDVLRSLERRGIIASRWCNARHVADADITPIGLSVRALLEKNNG